LGTTSSVELLRFGARKQKLNAVAVVLGDSLEEAAVESGDEELVLSRPIASIGAGLHATTDAIRKSLKIEDDTMPDEGDVYALKWVL